MIMKTLSSLIPKNCKIEKIETSPDVEHIRVFFNDVDAQLIADFGFSPLSGKALLLFCGRGNTPTNCDVMLKETIHFGKRLLKEGYLIVVPNCGSDSWGSPDATTIALKVLESLPCMGIRIPERLPVLGFSMGGLAALMFAVRHPDRIARIADVFGAVDLADIARRIESYTDNLTTRYPSPEIMAAATPLNYGKLLAQFPIAIYHGEDDELILPEYSRCMAQCLQENGGEVTFTMVPHYGHDNAILNAIADDLLKFICRE